MGKSTSILSRFVASGFFLGYAPCASGTVGSLGLLGIWILLKGSGLLSNWLQELAWLLLLFVVALVSTKLSLETSENQHTEEKSKRDPAFIVIDEWVGMGIALFGAEASSSIQILTAFATFRLFDIMKPGPVRWAEALPREWGVVMDDVVAGFFALFICLAAFRFFPMVY